MSNKSEIDFLRHRVKELENIIEIDPSEFEEIKRIINYSKTKIQDIKTIYNIPNELMEILSYLENNLIKFEEKLNQ